MTTAEKEKEWILERNSLLKELSCVNHFDWQDYLNIVIPSSENIIIPDDLRYVGGIDISYDKKDESRAVVCVIVVNVRTLQEVSRHWKLVSVNQPYVTGFLAFRECGHMVELMQELRQKLAPDLWPQLLLVDGHGRCHSARFGSASQLGVCLSRTGIPIPTVGVAKNYLQLADWPHRDVVKKQIRETLKENGDGELLYPLVDPHSKETVCMVRKHGLNFKQTRQNKILDEDCLGKLAFISPGHMITMDTAVNVVRLLSKCRVPEPIRLADHYSKEKLKTV